MACLWIPVPSDAAPGAIEKHWQPYRLDPTRPGYELFACAPPVQPRRGPMGEHPLLVPDHGENRGETWVVVTSDPHAVRINGLFLDEGFTVLSEGDIIQLDEGLPLRFTL